jgi:hypothetical protein
MKGKTHAAFVAFILLIVALPTEAKDGAAEVEPTAQAPSPKRHCDGEKRIDETSCNGECSSCCTWWYAGVFENGRSVGGVLEDSFAEVQRRVEENRQARAAVCRYLSPKDATACAVVVFGAPTCAGRSVGVRKQVVTLVRDGELEQARAFVKRQATEVVKTQKARLAAFWKAHDSFTKANDIVDASESDPARQYGMALYDVLLRVQWLQRDVTALGERELGELAAAVDEASNVALALPSAPLATPMAPGVRPAVVVGR